MRGMAWAAIPAAVVSMALWGCEGWGAGEVGEGDAPSEAELVEMARAAYDPFDYDTVKWASHDEAVTRGRDVFKWACAECHGAEGRGDGGRVIDGDTLRPPSMLRAGWAYADDPGALRARIFTGNTLGMPHWGLREMQPRDIVALERYIRYGLRSGVESPR